jgi:peptidoglycan/xylan/chitin deacetylase (PgdA/CDA1 family)
MSPRWTRADGPSPDSHQDDKVVVLCFDDAVKNHRTFVAPYLQSLGFGATFFVTHCWMIKSQDPSTKPSDYMTWADIAELHAMGFEVGSHSWTHANFAVPANAARMAGELALVDYALQQVGVPRPISYAHTGDHFGPEALQVLKNRGYRFARRGMSPEVPVKAGEMGLTYDPQKNYRLLVPATGIPPSSLEYFKKLVDRARPGHIVVVELHGIPDPHDFASTPRELFQECMTYLKEQNFRVVALRDLEKYLPAVDPEDPLLQVRWAGPESKIVLPTEMIATREHLDFWMQNMLRDHQYTWEEVSLVTGYSEEENKRRAAQAGIDTKARPPLTNGEPLRVLPYPGGRHPRIGFLEGAIDPQRGTKASVFLPWDPAGYVVVDLPETLFVNNQTLEFLAHTHVSTVWTEKNIWLENVDWTRNPDGHLGGSRVLPDKIAFGATVQPSAGKVEMELWLRNDTSEKLSGLRTQICVLLKGAPDFNSQTNDNKIFRSPVSAVKAAKGNRWILVAWDRCGHTWGNPPVPCMHADPVLADCLPGETVRVRGRLWFYEGSDIEDELRRAQQSFAALPSTN